MTTLNELLALRTATRAIREQHLGIAERRNASLSKDDTMRERQSRIVREALVIAATASVTLGDYESVGDAFSAHAAAIGFHPTPH